MAAKKTRRMFLRPEEIATLEGVCYDHACDIKRAIKRRGKVSIMEYAKYRNVDATEVRENVGIE